MLKSKELWIWYYVYNQIEILGNQNEKRKNKNDILFNSILIIVITWKAEKSNLNETEYILIKWNKFLLKLWIM